MIFNFKKAVNTLPDTGEWGDEIYLYPTNESYIYMDNGWEMISDGKTQEKTKIRVHPETCSHCGAALHSNICEYCGVEYTEEANGNNT